MNHVHMSKYNIVIMNLDNEQCIRLKNISQKIKDYETTKQKLIHFRHGKNIKLG